MRSDPAIDQVAANVKRLRVAKGMSQVELARRAQVDLRTVTRIEAALREPGVATLARLARGLDVWPGEFWQDVS